MNCLTDLCVCGMYGVCVVCMVCVCVYTVCVSYCGAVLQVLGVEQGMVGPEDDPVKQSAVKGLGHGVPNCSSLRAHTHTHQHKDLSRTIPLSSNQMPIH